MEPSAIIDESDDHDLYIREEIAKLDRTIFIYGNETEQWMIL